MTDVVDIAEDRREHGTTLHVTVVRMIAASIPEMEQARINGIVAAMSGRSRRAVHDHLAKYPDALVSGGSLASPPVQRLIQALADAGSDRVRTPVCMRCDRARPLVKMVEGGRVCGGCAGSIAYAASVGVCRKCSRTKPLPSQGLCSACYARELNQKAPKPKTPCADCGQDRVCRRSRSDGRPRCDACRPRPSVSCSLCGHRAKAQARWPVGPVCSGCYDRVRTNPVPCPACGITRALIGRNGNEAICGPCAGMDIDYTCTRCSAPADSGVGGRCDRCALDDQVAEFFDRLPPTAQEQLRPLRDRVQCAEEPRAARSWLKHSDAARLLAELAWSGTPLSNETLDAICLDSEREQVASNLRDVLADARILPPRDEHLAMVERRFARLIDQHPPFAAHLHAYGYGSVLPRLRSRERPATEYVTDWATARMAAAVQLLTWVDSQGLALDQLAQERVDQWLAEGPSTRHNVRDFVVWAADNGHAQPLLVPHRKKPVPVGMEAREHWGALQRCLRDETLPLDVRVAGGLVLFYGQQVSRVVALDRDCLRYRGEDCYILLGEVPVLMPPPLKRLVARLAADGAEDSTDRERVPSPWLFPSRLNHTRHQSAASLSARLNTYGISVKSGRATALMNAAMDASVDELSAQLGIHRITAAQWRQRATRAWDAHLAAASPARRSGRSEAVPQTGGQGFSAVYPAPEEGRGTIPGRKVRHGGIPV